MKITSFVFVLTQVMFFSTLSLAEYRARLFVNGQESNEVEAGKPMDWKIEFYNSKNNEKVKKFRSQNGKFIHLIILSNDYSVFTHAHPKHLGVSGDFYLGVNQEDDDVDSVGTSVAISKPGKYHVIAEVFPDIDSWVPVPAFVQFEVEAKGDTTGSELVFDEFDSRCMLNKYLKQSGQPGSYGNTYRVRMHPEFISGVGGTLIKFHFRVDTWDSMKQTYLPTEGLQPFMRMEGHLFLARLSPQTFGLEGYSHLHGMLHPGETGMIMTSYFDRGEILSKASPVKLWFQFKHKERVQVVNFTTIMKQNTHQLCGDH